MSWETRAIGDICTLVTSGGTPTSTNESYYNPPEVPWLRTGEVNYSRIYDTEKHISQEGLANSSAKLIPANSVIVAMYGQGDTAGRVAINKVPITTNQACCNLIIDSNKADYEYVYYVLCTMYEKMVSLKNGGAQPNLNAKIIKALEIPLPNIDTQHRIASILSTYDDLIENNRRQIKLLEEAAQRLYREWFVELRFPGHEGVKIVDGVPEGWKKGTLAEIAIINAHSVKNIDNQTVINYVDIGSVRNGQIEAYTQYLYGDAPGRARRKAQDGDIIWGMVRPNLKAYALVQHPNENDVFSTGFAVISANKVPFTYLYNTIIRDEFVSYLVNCTNGAAYPAVKPVHFEQAVVLIPAKEVLEKFHAFTEPMIRKIDVLSKQNTRLEQIRDMLLPKLMNGEMKVYENDI